MAAKPGQSLGWTENTDGWTTKRASFVGRQENLFISYKGPSTIDGQCPLLRLRILVNALDYILHLGIHPKMIAAPDRIEFNHLGASLPADRSWGIGTNGRQEKSP